MILPNQICIFVFVLFQITVEKSRKQNLSIKVNEELV